MVKKLKGGATPASVDNSAGAWIAWFFGLILKFIGMLILLIIIIIILFAGLAVVFMFIGSYIMLEYFLKMINYIVTGLNKLIKPITGGFKQLGVKIKGGKIKKVPTDPSQLVLKALGLPSLKDDHDNDAGNDPDNEYCDE